MMAKKAIVGCFAALALVAAAWSAAAADLTQKEKLGKNLFFDNRLSNPAGQSCASCHSPGSGFNGIGDANIMVFEGAVNGRFGNRNPPTAAYASFSPPLAWVVDGEDALYIGGQFWDGRRNTLAEQAKDPFLNPVEMNNKSKSAVVALVATSNYVNLFIKVYGVETCSMSTRPMTPSPMPSPPTRVPSRSISSAPSMTTTWMVLQRSQSRSLWDSPCLTTRKGQLRRLSPSAVKWTAVSAIHRFQLRQPRHDRRSGHPDLGLGGFLNDLNEYGKFKVPTLRNVASPPRMVTTATSRH